jgi:hypothetical protein
MKISNGKTARIENPMNHPMKVNILTTIGVSL